MINAPEKKSFFEQANARNIYDIFNPSSSNISGSAYLDDLSKRLGSPTLSSPIGDRNGSSGSTYDNFFKNEGFGKQDSGSFLGSPEFANSLKALDSIGALGNVFLGMKGLSLAKDQFKHNKKFDLFNANNQVATHNMNAEAKAKQANALDPGAVTAEELKKLKLSNIA